MSFVRYLHREIWFSKILVPNEWSESSESFFLLLPFSASIRVPKFEEREKIYDSHGSRAGKDRGNKNRSVATKAADTLAFLRMKQKMAERTIYTGKGEKSVSNVAEWFENARKMQAREREQEKSATGWFGGWTPRRGEDCKMEIRPSPSNSRNAAFQRRMIHARRGEDSALDLLLTCTCISWKKVLKNPENIRQWASPLGWSEYLPPRSLKLDRGFISRGERRYLF